MHKGHASERNYMLTANEPQPISQGPQAMEMYEQGSQGTKTPIMPMTAMGMNTGAPRCMTKAQGESMTKAPRRIHDQGQAVKLPRLKLR